MIFLLDKIENRYEVLVYEDLADLIQRVEWQDIFEGNSIISDFSGNTYMWDSSKKNEFATVHDYTLIKAERKLDFIDMVVNKYNSTEHLGEFEIEIKK